MKTSALDARLAALLELDEDDRQKELTRLSEAEHKEFRYHWELFARRDQRPPPGDWTTWLICAGRGFGKTRAGAEWVREIAKRHDDARIALVGTSLAEVRAVMVEGESGIIACSPPPPLSRIRAVVAAAGVAKRRAGHALFGRRARVAARAAT